MQRLILPITLLVITAGAVGLFLIVKSFQKGAKLTVYKEAGAVSFKENESGEYTSITEDEFEIPNNSFVKTAEDGLAHVVLPDDSMVSLGPDAEIQINFDTNTLVKQTLGSVWYRVKKLTGTKEFSVETPSSVAAVRGTIFGVERLETDEIYTVKDKLEVAQLVEEGGQKVRKNQQELNENKLAKVSTADRGLPEIIDIPEEKRQSPWFRRNEIIDREFEKGSPRDFIKGLRDNQELILLRQGTLGTSTLGGEFLQNFGSSDWLARSTETCAYINSQDFSQAIAEIGNYWSALGEWGSWLSNALQQIKGYCSDGAIDAKEALELEKLYSSQPSYPSP